ncbi:MAG: hypothetical protein HYU51_15820 [Candidatus Rokubacteria bacterium]|nr:hypothetical protein [Candidatus Rokubacteria bacterium]
MRLWTGDDVLYCQVVDHGVGFSPATSQEEESTGGLSGMRERARLLGGDVRVESVPAAGVVLTAELPPSRPDAARPEDPA